MKIGVISDTHRNIEYLTKAYEWLSHKHKIAALYHLGDDYEDVICLKDEFIEVAQVPGTYHPKYIDGSLPKKIVESVLGVRILLVHSIDKDLTSSDRSGADIILHGHTHHAEIKLEDGLLYLNPGHCKGPLDKNLPPSFGLLDIQDRSISATVFSMEFKIVKTMELMRSESGLYKV